MVGGRGGREGEGGGGGRKKWEDLLLKEKTEMYEYLISAHLQFFSQQRSRPLITLLPSWKKEKQPTKQISEIIG